MTDTTRSLLHRQNHHVEIAGDSGRSIEIVVQYNHCVPESIAEVINYANHTKLWTTDTKCREDM